MSKKALVPPGPTSTIRFGLTVGVRVTNVRVTVGVCVIVPVWVIVPVCVGVNV